MVSSKFASFPVRPPTPPKDPKDLDGEINEVLELLDDPFGTKKLLNTSVTAKSLLSTPEQSPSSETGSSSSSRKKRVNFMLQACNIPQNNGLIAQSWTPRHSSPLRPLPQTRVSKPLKSILKASDPTSTPPQAEEGATAHKFQTFAEMLESVVKMLAQGARPSKLDAYISLQRTMQAYEKVPDIEALSNKMGLFSQFIRRDMQAISISGAGPDSQLIQQALKFLMVLLRIQELKNAMDDEFCSFLVDRSIAIGADASMPKGIINTHLALLMQQNFRSKVMTISRVERILDVLDDVHDRVTGYSVQAYRLRVYRKLIQQKPDVMKKHTERWFKHTIKAMLSIQKDIHQSALDTALSAARSIGSDRLVTKAVLSLLNRVNTDGDSFGKLMVRELDKALSSESAPLVPQIWATITAFLQDSLHESAFSAAREWLHLFQKFFTYKVEAVRIQANVAFSFLVYAVNITQSTASTWSKMLVNIPQHRLKRRGSLSKSEIEPTTSGYLTLLYYAFPPTASPTQLDRYWKEFVAEFWTSLVKSSSSSMDAVVACRVVSALFSGSRKPWNQHRGLELKLQSMVQRSELPSLDPKWVRKSLATVLQFVETLLDTTPWTSDIVEEEPVKTLWITLLDSLVEASSKEVMATSETKDAIAHIVNMLRRMWDRHTAQLALPQQKEDSWADKFCFLIGMVIQKLGALQFADKCLTRNTRDEFEVAPTPSRSRHHGPRVSPLLYFVDLLVGRSEGRLSDPVRLRVLDLVLEPCLDVQNTRLAKLELLVDCSAAVNSSSTNVVASNFWGRIGTLTRSCIEHSSDSQSISRQLGKEYEAVVQILTLGSVHLLTTRHGQELLSVFADTVRREAGEGAVVIAVIEKVSGSVLTNAEKEDKPVYLPYISILLRNLPKTINKRTLEQGRQNLYPSSPAPARSHEFDPYNRLYSAIVSTGSAAYQCLERDNSENTCNFLAALASSIRQSPISLLAVYLRKIQDCITPWIEDMDGKMQSKDQAIKHVRHEVVTLWQAVSAATEKLPKKDSAILKALEPLLSAGFQSRRRDIVNISVTTWNSTFGKENNLQYPVRLAKALQRLRGTVELSTPSLEDRIDDADVQPVFYDSDSSASETKHEKPSAPLKESPFRINKSARKSRSPAVTSTGSRRHSSRQVPKIRLRHDNSQIQFEPIVSSPTNPFNQESQILTDRQKEMIERQKSATSFFSSIGSLNEPHVTSPRQSQGARCVTEAVDELPNADSTTPLKTLAAMGPMDVYLGSSPTPQARIRNQQTLSDESSIATPIAVRRMQLPVDSEELGSSPPRFEKLTAVDAASENDAPNDARNDSADCGQAENSSLMSFDEGTTIDEELLPDADVTTQPRDLTDFADELPSELDSIEVPSSTIEFQLNAQLDADLAACNRGSVIEEQTAYPSEAFSGKVDFASAETDAPIEGQQSDLTGTGDGRFSASQSLDTSLVKDSFIGSTAGDVIPADLESHVRSVRRSSRHSAPSSPAQQPTPKRRRQSSGTANRQPKKLKREDSMAEETTQQEPSQQDDDANDMIDCIVLAPASRTNSSKKRKRGRPTSKSQASSQASSASQSIVPETTRKVAGRRSASLLSQAETPEDDSFVKDTPAPKRSRKSVNQDVSEAKNNALEQSQPSQVKRLSHVQVSPRPSSSRGSSVADEENNTAILNSPTGPDQATSSRKLKAKATPNFPGAAATQEERSQPQPATAATATPNRSFTERVILTPRGILGRIRKMISDCSQMMLGREEERDIDDALFDLRKAVHAAGSRGQEGQQ